MHSHLDIKVENVSLGLKPDANIDITVQNPLFNKVEAFSLPIDAPVSVNRQLLQNVEVPLSDKKPSDLDGKQATIFVDGLPVVGGRISTEGDEEIGDSVSVNIDSISKSFSDLIADLQCNEVPVPEEIVIGEKVGQVSAAGNLTFHKRLRTYEGMEGGPGRPARPSYSWEDMGEETTNVNFYLDLPALGFSYPAECYEDIHRVATPDPNNPETEYADMDIVVKNPYIKTSYINTANAFDADHPYCNARVCYKHLGVKKEGEGDNVSYETTSELTDDKEQNNEAVWPYWVLDANRPQSGICFYVLYFLRCLFEHLGIDYDDSELMAVEDMRRLCFFTTKCKYTVKTLAEQFFLGQKEDFEAAVNAWAESRGCGGQIAIEEALNRTVKIEENETMFYEQSVGTITYKADLQQMLATGENFPDVPVSEVISSLENSFGIRFLFNQDNSHCQAIFIRDVFGSRSDVHSLLGEVLSVRKLTEKNTGVKVCYSAESDAKEQRANIRNGVRDYETNYDYIDYPEPQDTVIIGKTQTITDKVYREISKRLSSTDMNVYVDQTTGNAYRIKIDGDAKTVDEWKPVLFEVGGYKGVEEGDCSPSNENLIELVSNFQPVMMNDVNYQQEVDDETATPVYAPFLDVDMEHEFIPFILKSTAQFDGGSVTINARMQLKESYDPSNTDDGNSPLQEIDWGLAVSVMRGGGATATTDYYDQNYDGFGNWRWRLLSGKDYQMFGDTITHFGAHFDYNGEQSGIGDGERFSLKMRGYKQPEWSDTPLFTGTASDRRRGLYDVFMYKYVHFLLNRKPFRITALCTAAELADMQANITKWFEIDGMLGLINKFNYSATAEKGIGRVTIDFFAI